MAGWDVVAYPITDIGLLQHVDVELQQVELFVDLPVTNSRKLQEVARVRSRSLYGAPASGTPELGGWIRKKQEDHVGCLRGDKASASVRL